MKEPNLTEDEYYAYVSCAKCGGATRAVVDGVVCTECRYVASTVVDVGEIVDAYLEKHGFDGLVASDGECACEKGDLAPCGSPSMLCRAGYKGACDCGEHDWHIYPTKADALASLEYAPEERR